MLSARTVRLRKIGMTLAALWLLLTVAWMIPPVQRWMIARVIIPLAVRSTQRDMAAANRTSALFQQRVKAGDYAGAHQLLTTARQKKLSIGGLRGLCVRAMAKRGPIGEFQTLSSAQQLGWPTRSFTWGGRLLDRRHKMMGRFTMHLVSESGVWRIDNLAIVPLSPSQSTL